MNLLLLLFCLICCATATNAQSRFAQDSISIEYAQCKGDTAKVEVLLINRGSTLEILDLRFADSNRTWEIYDTSGTYSFVKGAVLFAGDTLNLKLRQRRIGEPGSEWYRDTLVTSGAATSDTLLLNSRIQTADLQTDLANVDLGTVLQNGDASRSFKIWNNGEVPHVFHYTLSPGWALEGLAIGDTLMPGDTVDVRLMMLSTASLGTFSTIIWIHGDCDGLEPRNGTVKIIPAHAHWTSRALIDTVTGCEEAHTFEIAIKNSSTSDTRIDSIQFLGQGAPYWAITEADLLPWNLAAGSTKILTLIRNPGVTTTRLVIQSDKAGADTLPVSITSRITKPRIRNYRDTVTVEVATNDDLVYLLEVQNQGPGNYRFTDYQLVASPHWSLLGFDTVTTAGVSKTLQVKLVFSGAASAGDYPAKLSLQGAECDTILSQVVIARVVMLDVAEDHMQTKTRIYPFVAGDAITIESITGAEYSIYDVLGNELLRAALESDKLKIDVSTIPTGSYYVRVSTDGGITTHRIVISR